MTTIASAKPTWASWGVPATTSPTAHTLAAVRLLVAVGHHEPPLVEPDPGALGEQALGPGPAADRHDDRRDVDLAAVAQGDGRPRARRSSGACPFTWAPVITSIPRLRKDRATTAATSASHPARIDVERLEHGHRRPRGPRGARRTRTRWHRRRPRPPRWGTRSRSKNSSEVRTRRPSTSRPGQRAGHRAGGQHDVAPDHLGSGVLAVDHPDPAAGQQRPGAREHRDLAALKQTGQAPEELVDHRVLAGLADGEVDGRGPGDDAERRRPRPPCD